MWLFVAIVSIGAGPSPAPEMVPVKLATAVSVRPAPTLTKTRRFESINFVVQSYLHPARADEVAGRCETLCLQLRRRCLGAEETPSWNPKCEVVLHSTRQSYLAAVGQGGGQTVGSSVIGIDGGRILHRRIDLLAEDRDRALSALPHELVHVLFAELFPNAAPPRWAEEGFALLNDPDDKRARHRRDLHYALRTKTTLSLNDLLSATDYPTDWQRAVFYGQSMSLVEYLTRLDTPQQFVRFVKLCMDMGRDHALKAVYNINGLGDLERRWHQHALASAIPQGPQSPSAAR
jgi:hypothetical protein